MVWQVRRVRENKVQSVRKESSKKFQLENLFSKHEESILEEFSVAIREKALKSVFFWNLTRFFPKFPSQKTSKLHKTKRSFQTNWVQ